MKNQKCANHSFDPQIATEYGINEAILIHHFQFWIQFNATRNKNFHEERFWTYGTIDEIASHFPYFTPRQVDYAIQKLVDNKILIKGNFNKLKMDRTIWYAFENQEMFGISQNCKMEKTKMGNGSHKIVEAIPYPKTDTIKDSPPPSSSKILSDQPKRERGGEIHESLKELNLPEETKVRISKMCIDGPKLERAVKRATAPGFHANDLAAVIFSNYKEDRPPIVTQDSLISQNKALGQKIANILKKSPFPYMIDALSSFIEIYGGQFSMTFDYSDLSFVGKLRDFLEKRNLMNDNLVACFS